MGFDALEVEGLSKAFGQNKALQSVQLSVRPGEVHGLLGQNGSGKSTLIKILSGYHRPDSVNSIRAYGDEVQFPIDAAEHKRLGWAFVHQDLGLLRDLTILDNFQLVRFSASSALHVRWRREQEQVEAALDAFGLRLNVRDKVKSLAGAEQAMIAIVRAAEEIKHYQQNKQSGGLLILDEPTVFLPEDEARKLFGMIERVAKAGTSVIFVSHRLSEIRGITDRVTVLRDGMVSGTVQTSETTDHEIVEMIVGKEVRAGRIAARQEKRREQLRVDDLHGGPVRSTSFEIYGGEVLGITGLQGSGFESILYFLYGARKADGGMMVVDGERLFLPKMEPQKSNRLGVALIPADRRNSGGALGLSLYANLTAPVLPQFVKNFMLNKRMEVAYAEELVRDFGVRPQNPYAKFGHLSGGNQQKVLLAKWLATRPNVLLLHEPVQGLDVEARNEVNNRIRNIARSGISVVVASADFDEVANVADRALIFRDGRVRQVLEAHEITARNLADASFRKE